MIEDELYHDVILHLENLIDPLGYPGLEYVHLDLRHVHLNPEIVLELHSLEKLLLLIRKAVVLVSGGPSEETGISHIADLYLKENS